MDKISFFSADYRDSRVHIGGKSYVRAKCRRCGREINYQGAEAYGCENLAG